MSDERSGSIRPALTAEEWESGKVFFRAARKHDEGYGLEVTGDSIWAFDDSWALILKPETRQATAALALHNQPFGFTWEMLDKARFEIESGVGEDDEFVIRRVVVLDEEDWLAIADRIAALLPPRRA